MLDLIDQTNLPAMIEFQDASAGIELDTLKSLQTEWLTHFDWEKEQERLNK
jgi:hypothetical protein